MLPGNGGLRLGVDLGTSHTVGMLAWPDGRTQTLLFDASPLLPSSVYAESDGRILVGRDAVRSARLHPERFEPHPKRRVDDGTVLLGTAEYPTEQLLGAVLRRVLAEAARVAGQQPSSVVLTHPAGWGSYRRELLTRAARGCGLSQVTLLPEPVAAAVYFNQVLGHQVRHGNAVVVYDFGGGTFDVSVVRRLPDGCWDVIASEGLDSLGGVDLDAAVVNSLGEVIASRDAQVWQRLASSREASDRRNRLLLYADARAAKEQLSRQASTGVHIPLLDDDVPVTREQFEHVARPYLERTVALTAETLVRTGVARTDVAGLFLVGGSSRIPLVATMLHQRLGVPPTVLEQPELVVAQGAVQATAPSSQPAPQPAHPTAPAPPGGAPHVFGTPSGAGSQPAPLHGDQSGRTTPGAVPVTSGWPGAPGGGPSAAPPAQVVGGFSSAPPGATRVAPSGSTWWPSDQPWWRRRLTVVFGYLPIVLVLFLVLGYFLLPEGSDPHNPAGGTGSAGDVRARDNATAFESEDLEKFAEPWLADFTKCKRDKPKLVVEASEAVWCVTEDRKWGVWFFSYRSAEDRSNQRSLLRDTEADGASVEETAIEHRGTRMYLVMKNKEKVLYWDRGDELVAGLMASANKGVDLKAIWNDHVQ